MKTTNTFRESPLTKRPAANGLTKTACAVALTMLAALPLASCSDDDDDIAETSINRALFEMKNDYTGKLKYGLKDSNWRDTVENVAVKSADGLWLAIPLEPIAEQMADEAVARKLREWQTAVVHARYEFVSVEEEYYSFRLTTEMWPDERFAQPPTRTQPVVYGGLTLLFDQRYTGEYQKQGECLSFNICVGGLLWGQEYVEGFKPVVYRYEGHAPYPPYRFNLYQKNGSTRISVDNLG